ncbi:hypothetical protein M3Y99_01993400 [Aphelenchoides fujianensis]|nr:hypothetical protein M3Y99_01993400 [Aphelenchoides fujianensis]
MESPLRSRFRLRSSLGRRLVAEFTATALLMYMGFCVNSQTVLSRGELNGSLGTIVGWGFSLVFAVQMAFHTSTFESGHFLFAVELRELAHSRLPVLYSAVQTTACFFGAALSFVHYYDPARDFGPRLFTLLVYGPEVFTCWSGLWFLIPLICPFFGAVGGSWAYQLLVGFQMPDENAPSSLPSSASSAADLIADRPKLQIHALV